VVVRWKRFPHEGNSLTKRFEFNVADGKFDALVFEPKEVVAPGVLIVPEVFGRSTHMRDNAAALARSGFLVGVLDIHWRLEAEVALEPHDVERARALHQQLNYESAVSDIEAAVEQFRAGVGCSGKVGIVGYCLGGTLTWIAAARTGADACVSYYGTRIPKYLDAASRFAHPLLMHLGANDHFTPPEVIAQIDSATKGNPLVECFVYPDAGHAFCNPAQAGFNPLATELANRRTIEFLQRHLD
jgi:carboxymethylenebutenolidase